MSESDTHKIQGVKIPVIYLKIIKSTHKHFKMSGTNESITAIISWTTGNKDGTFFFCQHLFCIALKTRKETCIIIVK